jgi:hypothetical protein
VRRRSETEGWNRTRSALAALVGTGAVLVLAACGSSSSGGGSPSEQAASMPGSRQVVIPTDREVTLMVPQCPADTGATTEGQQQATIPENEVIVPSEEEATGALEGANRIVLPKDSGVHTVLISACTTGSSSSSGGSSGGGGGGGGGSSQMTPPSPGPNTVTITPGEQGSAKEKSAAALPGVGQVVLPEGSDADTVIVPPCVGSAPQQSGGSSGGGSSGGGGAPTSNVILPAESEGGRVTAPNCSVPTPPSG